VFIKPGAESAIPAFFGLNDSPGLGLFDLVFDLQVQREWDDGFDQDGIRRP
jgi:hypothetical protein